MLPVITFLPLFLIDEAVVCVSASVNVDIILDKVTRDFALLEEYSIT